MSAGEDVNEAGLVDRLLAGLTADCGGYPGPSPSGWAYLAAAAVRGLNHASLAGDGYRYPGDVDAVVADLATLAQRLPQAMTQAARALAAAHDAGQVVDVTGPARTDTTVDTDVVAALTVLATDVTTRLQAGLAAVHCATSRLAYAGPFPNHDDDQADDNDDQADDNDDQADDNDDQADDNAGHGVCGPDRAGDRPTPLATSGPRPDTPDGLSASDGRSHL